MPDFLTRRNGSWHFVRRVPIEFAQFDPRGIIKHSTKVRVADDRNGRRATRVADRLNAELEAHWQNLAGRNSTQAFGSYEAARRCARSLGFEYVEHSQLLSLPAEAILQRLETLVAKGLVNDQPARAALLGTEKRPAFALSKLFEEYESSTKDERKDFSPSQLRIWKIGRVRAVREFVEVVGDKEVTELTHDDAIDLVEWWRERVVTGEANAKTANKAVGQLSRMLKEMSIRRRLQLPDLFKGLRLRGEKDKARSPFSSDFIQNKLLALGALDELNDEARRIIYVIADTGMRLSEVCNLTSRTVCLHDPIPHVKVLPEGRCLKTEDSEREIPLVGAALSALRLHPDGFPRYRDKSSGLSATLNKFMRENELRPSKEHTVYSLRHSFKDRLIAAEAPDSLIDSLMGHRTGKPKYGKGPSLELKLKFLERIAFTPPSRL